MGSSKLGNKYSYGKGSCYKCMAVRIKITKYKKVEAAYKNGAVEILRVIPKD